jgi:transcriptional regulator with XRE-family HTH domain
MDIPRKDKLARLGESSKAATAARLRGAIRATGMAQAEFARRSGQNASSLHASLSEITFPSRRTLQELYRTHRIDPTFILFGDYGQMPIDVQDRVFLALEYEAALAREALEQVEEND